MNKRNHIRASLMNSHADFFELLYQIRNQLFPKHHNIPNVLVHVLKFSFFIQFYISFKCKFYIRLYFNFLGHLRNSKQILIVKCLPSERWPNFLEDFFFKFIFKTRIFPSQFHFICFDHRFSFERWFSYQRDTHIKDEDWRV